MARRKNPKSKERLEYERQYQREYQRERRAALQRGQFYSRYDDPNAPKFEHYSKSAKFRSNQWALRGKIWRTLAIYENLTTTSLARLTGEPKDKVNYILLCLEKYGGVSRTYAPRGSVWRAEGEMLKEWEKVLL